MCVLKNDPSMTAGATAQLLLQKFHEVNDHIVLNKYRALKTYTYLTYLDTGRTGSKW